VDCPKGHVAAGQERVGDGGRKLRAPQAPVVPAGGEPQPVGQAEAAQLRGERPRVLRRRPVVRRAGGEEEPRPQPAQQRGLLPGEQRRVVRPTPGGVRVDERTRAQRVEVPAPGLERAEQPRVPEPDVHGAVAAGGEAGEHAAGPRRDRRQVGVGPRHDLADEVPLPAAGPVAVVRVDPGRRDHREERRERPGGDLPVRVGGQVEAVDELVGRAREALEQVDDGVAAGRVVARREVDERRPEEARHGRIRDPALDDDPAVRPRRDPDEPGRRRPRSARAGGEGERGEDGGGRARGGHAGLAGRRWSSASASHRRACSCHTDCSCAPG
jgi:hypothetical protein